MACSRAVAARDYLSLREDVPARKIVPTEPELIESRRLVTCCRTNRPSNPAEASEDAGFETAFDRDAARTARVLRHAVAHALDRHQCALDATVGDMSLDYVYARIWKSAFHKIAATIDRTDTAEGHFGVEADFAHPVATRKRKERARGGDGKWRDLTETHAHTLSPSPSEAVRHSA